MKINIVLLFVITCLSSCVGTKRFSKFVSEKCEPAIFKETNITSNYIKFKVDNLSNQDTLVKIKRIKKQFIPAVLYWQYESTFECSIAPKAIASKICGYMESYAETVNLSQKIDGRKIEISIDKLPNSFVFTEKGYVIFLVFAYAAGGVEAIVPQNENLRISYRIFQDNNETQKGSITILNEDKPIKNFSNTMKRFTWKYLDNYDSNLNNLCEKAIDKLLIEL